MSDQTATDPAAAGAPPNDGGQSAAVSVSDDWKSSLPDDVKALAGDHRTPADALKALHEAGQGRVQVPGDDASDEDRAAFRAALGVPENPDGYEISLGDGGEVDENLVGAFRQWAHDAGLTPKQAQAMAQGWQSYVGEAQAKQAEAAEQAAAQAKQKLDSDLTEAFGAQKDAKVALAQRAAKAFGGQDVLDALEKQVGGAALVKMFAAIGEKIGEDRIEPGAAGGGSPQDQEARLAAVLYPSMKR